MALLRGAMGFSAVCDCGKSNHTQFFSKYGRLATAIRHHLILASTLPEVWSTMYTIKWTSSTIRALTALCQANQMRKENVNIVGDKPVKNETEDVD